MALNFDYVINDIVNKSVYVGNTGKKDDDLRQRKRELQWEHSRPVQHAAQKPQILDQLHDNGLIRQQEWFYQRRKEHKQGNLTLVERAGIDFRSDYLDLGLNG
ncbi:MAG: hypothetical protein ACLRS8_04920 [Parabacteroides merdae]